MLSRNTDSFIYKESWKLLSLGNGPPVPHGNRQCRRVTREQKGYYFHKSYKMIWFLRIRNRGTPFGVGHHIVVFTSSNHGGICCQGLLEGRAEEPSVYRTTMPLPVSHSSSLGLSLKFRCIVQPPHEPRVVNQLMGLFKGVFFYFLWLHSLRGETFLSKNNLW